MTLLGELEHSQANGRENASRLMLNKALQEEIVNLHRELLAVRQTTASMALKIKSLEDEMAQLRSEVSVYLELADKSLHERRLMQSWLPYRHYVNSSPPSFLPLLPPCL